MSGKKCYCSDCEQKRRREKEPRPTPAESSETKKRITVSEKIALACKEKGKHTDKGCCGKKHGNCCGKDHCGKDHRGKDCCEKDHCEKDCDNDCRGSGCSRPIYVEIVQPDQCCPSQRDPCCPKKECCPPLHFSGTPAGLGGMSQQLLFMGLGQQNTDEFLVAYLAGCTGEYNTIQAAVKVITLPNACATLRFRLMRRPANSSLNDPFLPTDLCVDVPVVSSGHATQTVSASCACVSICTGDLVVMSIQLVQMTPHAGITFTGTAVVSST